MSLGLGRTKICHFGKIEGWRFDQMQSLEHYHALADYCVQVPRRLTLLLDLGYLDPVRIAVHSSLHG